MRDVAGSWSFEAAGEALEEIIAAAAQAGPQSIEQDGKVLVYFVDGTEYDLLRRSQRSGDEPDRMRRT